MKNILRKLASVDLFIAVMFLIVIAVVCLMTYDFAKHNTRFAIWQACMSDGYADVGFAAIACTELTEQDAPGVLDRHLHRQTDK